MTANPDEKVSKWAFAMGKFTRIFFQDSYLVNVSASVAPTKPAEQADNVDETINMISTTERDVVGKRIKNEE